MYKLLSAPTPNDLEKQVQEYLDRQAGWELVAGPWQDARGWYLQGLRQGLLMKLMTEAPKPPSGSAPRLVPDWVMVEE